MRPLTTPQTLLPLTPTPNSSNLGPISPASRSHFRISRISAPNALIPLEFTDNPTIKPQKRKKAEMDRAKGQDRTLLCLSPVRRGADFAANGHPGAISPAGPAAISE
jgi:hypothetical protein